MENVNFKDNLLMEINNFRTSPPTLIKKCEKVRIGLTRLKGNENFIKEIDYVIAILNSIPKLATVVYNEELSKFAEMQLQKCIKEKNYPCVIEGANINQILDGVSLKYNYACLIEDEGAESPSDVIPKVILNKNDKEKKGRKAMLNETLSQIGIAHTVFHEENFVIIIFVDTPVEIKQRTGEVPELKQAFDFFDVNHIGLIDPKETLDAMRNLGYEILNPTLFNIMKELDIPEYNQTKVDFPTFEKHIVKRVEETSTEEGLKRIFNLYVDNSSSKTITINTLKSICKELGEGFSEEEVKTFLGENSLLGAKRGPRKHLKRIRAPKHWLLSKVGGIWTTKPSQGPHKLRESIPLNVLLRNKLRLALTGREAKLIVMAKEGNIAVDGKIRKDHKFPVGFMDVITLIKTKVNYRLLYDVKGRFGLAKISPSEAEFKLCKVKRRSMGHKGVPYIVTHDGRTLRFPHPNIKENDTVRLNLKTNEIANFYKYSVGATVMITGGNNIGRVGTIERLEKHEGSYEIVHIKDQREKTFSTRLSNIFVIGSKDPEITLLKTHIRYSIIEEREFKNSKKPVAMEAPGGEEGGQ